MKKFIIHHLSLIIIGALCALTAFAQTDAPKLDILPTIKVEANPINIAAVLIQANDTAAITSTLRYYGYTPSTPLTPDTSKPETSTSLTPDTSKPETSTSLTPRHLKPETSTSLTPDTSKPETLYTHPNGSTIRVSFPTPAENGKRKTENLHTTIEVTSKGTHKEKEQLLLQHLNFQKVGNAYEQKSVGFTVRATFAPHGTLILKRLPKSKE